LAFPFVVWEEVVNQVKKMAPGRLGFKIERKLKSRYYSERLICKIVWLVASEHLYNMTNIGLNIHSDMLCDISGQNLSVSRVET